MRLHEITEAVAGIYSPVAQDQSDIENMQQALRKYDLTIAIKRYNNDIRIYRGMPSESKILFADSRTVNRRASSGGNTVNAFVSNDESWASFPKRDSSFICATGSDALDITNEFGKSYIVLPIGNPNIGIAPTTDFWDGFQQTLTDFRNQEENRLFFYGSNDISDMVRDIGRKLFRRDASSFEEVASINGLIRRLKKIDPAKIAELLEKFPINFFRPENTQTLFEFMRELLSPTENNFSTIKLGNLQLWQYSKECWFSGEAIFISLDIADQVIEGILQ
jgi:hypothetical protein